MTKYITEVLTELNELPKAVDQYRTMPALKLIFEYAYDPEKRFVLPDDAPPYTPDSAPIGMSPANLYQEVKRFYVFCREDISNTKRETLFTQLLENLHPTEAELVLAIKDQNLTSLYPNLTHKFAYENMFCVVPPTKKPQPTVPEPKQEEVPFAIPALQPAVPTKKAAGRPKAGAKV